MCDSCHEVLSKYIGKEIKQGTITYAYTMLHPNNDMFIVKLKESGKSRKFMRWELFPEECVTV